MSITPLKSMFGDRLRGLLSQSPLRQRDVAEELGISNSAVSQMMSGKIIPQQEQLNVICQMMKLDRDQSAELAALLSRIRNGERIYRSKFNQLLFSARCERGLDPQQLANLTGVACSRLQILENCHGAMPTLEEINRLAPVLSCSPEDMLVNAGLARPTYNGSSVSVNDHSIGYQVQRRSLPLLKLEQLKSYQPSREPFFSFAMTQATLQTDRGTDLRMPAVALLCPAQEINLGGAGEVLLLVTVDRPVGYRAIELCMNAAGQFFLREELSSSGWEQFRLTPETGDAPDISPMWSLFVLELTLRPQQGA